MQKLLKIVAKEKDGHTFYNIYLMGVAIRTVRKEDYAKLYYLVKGHIANDEQ